MFFCFHSKLVFQIKTKKVHINIIFEGKSREPWGRDQIRQIKKENPMAIEGVGSCAREKQSSHKSKNRSRQLWPQRDNHSVKGLEHDRSL